MIGGMYIDYCGNAIDSSGESSGSVAVVLFMIASFALLLPFDDQVKRFVLERFGEPAGELVSGLAPFPSVVVLFAGLFWLERKSKKIPEFSCPACRKFIDGMRYLIVATK